MDDKALAYLKREITVLSGFGSLTAYGHGSYEAMLSMLRLVYQLEYVKHEFPKPDEFRAIKD